MEEKNEIILYTNVELKFRITEHAFVSDEHLKSLQNITEESLFGFKLGTIKMLDEHFKNYNIETFNVIPELEER